jgi:beta-phosphoglucomutase-like phosphatase (HAD superfamily)
MRLRKAPTTSAAASKTSTSARPEAPNGERARPATGRRLRALIFDVDGTLADTEREGHLVACNDAFAALGIPIRWNWEEYRELLKIPGSQNRMRRALEELGTLRSEEIDDTAARLFELKQERYIELVPRLRLKPGVEDLLERAVERGIRLAIVSTSSEPQIRALLASRLAAFADLFDPVLGQQSGAKVGDEGTLYERCVSELRLGKDSIVAIEDAEDGFQAARRAGVACVVVPSGYSTGGDFRGARLVAPSLVSVNLDILELLL